MLFVYILLPFIFSFIFAIFYNLKNVHTTRRLAHFFSTIHFIFSICVLFSCQQNKIVFLDNFFLFDAISKYLLFLVGLIFFLSSIISKTFISKFSRAFFATGFLLLGLINLAICANNIFIFLISLFWIFLVIYFLSTLFSKKEAKKIASKTLACDIFCLFVAISLIIKEFARYFIINEINFSFSNLTQYLYKIDDFAISLAFFGFFIIISRLFNFAPFGNKKTFDKLKINPFVNSINSITTAILGSYLFIRCYINFDYLFYQYQDKIAIFLLLNFIFFILLALKQKNITKFLNSIFNLNIIIAIFSTFSFREECHSNFMYYIIALSLCYCFSLFVFAILEKKFNTNNINDFRKITDNTKLTQLIIFTSLLNITPIPLLPLFNCELFSFLMMFSTDYESKVLNIAPYFLIFGAFAMSLAVFWVLNKVLMEPSKKTQNTMAFSYHQIITFAIFVMCLILFTFSSKNFFKIFTNF